MKLSIMHLSKQLFDPDRFNLNFEAIIVGIYLRCADIIDSDAIIQKVAIHLF